MSVRHPRLQSYTECPNCSAKLEKTWRFCPACGQENEERVVPFRVLVGDFLSDFLTFDSRFFRTILPFLFKPGVVTRDYLKGKRMTYVAPMRILLFGCVLLFALAGRIVADYDWEDSINLGDSGVSLDIEANDSIAIETDSGTVNTTFGQLMDTLDHSEGGDAVDPTELAEAQEAIEAMGGDGSFVEGIVEGWNAYGEDQAATDSTISEPAALLDSIFGGSEGRRNLFNWMEKVGEQIPALADSMSAQAIGDSLAPDAGWLKHKVVVQMAKVYQSKGQGMVGFAVSNGTVSVFLAVLLMALLLKLLYWHPRRRYVEHVVFSVHGHAALVYLTLFMMLIYFITEQWYDQAYILLLPYYALSMRRVYGQGWLRSIFKTFLVGSVYTIVLLPTLTLLALGLSFLFF